MKHLRRIDFREINTKQIQKLIYILLLLYILFIVLSN